MSFQVSPLGRYHFVRQHYLVPKGLPQELVSRVRFVHKGNGIPWNVQNSDVYLFITVDYNSLSCHIIVKEYFRVDNTARHCFFHVVAVFSFPLEPAILI